MVGPSVPARRPFYRPKSAVPDLIQEASNYAAAPVFVYSLAGGWPSSNSAIRLIASLLAVFCSFSFAFIASVASQRRSRVIFSICLSVTALFTAIAIILDIVSIVKTAGECRDGKCVTSVPEVVLISRNICECSVAWWFYCTLLADVVLLVSASTCLGLTLYPMIKRRGIDPA